MNKYIGLSEQLLYELDNRPKREIYFWETIQTGENFFKYIMRYDKEEHKKDRAEIEKIVVKFKHLREIRNRRDSLCQQQQK